MKKCIYLILLLAVATALIYSSKKKVVQFESNKQFQFFDHNYVLHNTGGDELNPALIQQYEDKLYMVNEGRKSLKIFDKSGHLLYKYELASNLIEITDFQITDTEIIIGDKKSRSILKYDTLFNLLESEETTFYFSSFSYSNDRYIFYNPQIKDSNLNSILLTDGDLNIIKSMFPKKTTDVSLSIYPEFRMKKANNGVFFNPAGSSIIYQIDFDGNTETILNVGLRFEKLDFNTVESLSRDNLQEILDEMPINNFIVSDDLIVFDNYIDKVPYFFIYDRDNTGMGKFPRRVKMNNLEDDFNYVGKFPNTSNGDEFITYHTHKYSKFISDNIQSKSYLDHIPQTSTPDEFIIQRFRIK